MPTLQDSDDLDAFLDPEDFGVEAIIDGKSVDGIFDNDFLLADLGVGMESRDPRFMVKTTDVKSVVHDDSVLVPDEISGGTTTYKVKGIEPDGTGITTLVLEKR